MTRKGLVAFLCLTSTIHARRVQSSEVADAVFDLQSGSAVNHANEQPQAEDLMNSKRVLAALLLDLDASHAFYPSGAAYAARKTIFAGSPAVRAPTISIGMADPGPGEPGYKRAQVRKFFGDLFNSQPAPESDSKPAPDTARSPPKRKRDIVLGFFKKEKQSPPAPAPPEEPEPTAPAPEKEEVKAEETIVEEPKLTPKPAEAEKAPVATAPAANGNYNGGAAVWKPAWKK